MKGFATPLLLIPVSALLALGVYIVDQKWFQPDISAVGGDPFYFTSAQLADTTGVSNGDCLITDGTFNSWSSGCGGSSGATTLDGLNDVTITSSSTGNILYLGGSGQWVNLATGSDGQVLKLASGIPSWDTDNTGSGGGATTTINGVSGPAFTFASGTATGIGLTISTSTGTITFTPTVSSGYVIPLSASTSEWTTSRNIVTASSTLWDTAYSWGNHATFGYLTGISWGAITGTLSNQTDLQSALNAKQDTLTTGNLTENIAGLEFNATRQVIGGAAQLSLTSGYTIPLSASTTEWTAAYASTTALTPAYIRGLFSNTATGLSYNSGTGATSLAAGYVIPLSASTSEWANFHTTPSGRITAGDALTWSGNTLNFDGGANPAGDLGGTWASPSVDDDSHAHTGATLSGIDISDDTNLTAGNNITLTGDNLDVDDAFLLNTGDTGTGNYSFSGLLTNTGTTTLATTTIGGVLTFGGVAGSAWTDFCTTITGGAGLCDGSDDGGGGGGGLGSTTPWTAGQLAVVATDGLVKSIATSTLSENISGLEFDANPWIVGSARTLSLSSGYVIPLSASTTEWSLAYASTTALTPSYIRGLFSNTATGLTYNSSTGATSLTSGYEIPLTASTTEWHNFHTTPSGRITAGTGIDWSGNTLNGVYTAGDALTLNGEDFDFDGGATPSGDLGGTWASPSVTDDSHAHTGATISGIDVSSDTNLTVTATGLELSADAIALTTGYVVPLTASTTEWTNFYNSPSTRITDGTGLTWSGNTMNVDDVYVLNTGDSISGDLTFSGTGANIALGSNYLSGDGGDEGVFVSSTGLVGIGTTTPTQILHVVDSGQTKLLVDGNTAGASHDWSAALELRSNTDFRGRGVFMTTRDSAAEWYAGIRYSGTAYTIGYDASGGQAEYASTSRMTITSAGNVGIGTTTLGARLSLQTTGTTDILNLFETGGTEVFSVLESGNVGIGTSTPAAKLDLTGTAGSGNIFTVSSSTNSRLLTLNALGYLGIGSSTPSAPLVVDDGVNATSTVQIGGPGSVGCLAIRDTDDAGYTYVTALNGVLSASMTSCE